MYSIEQCIEMFKKEKSIDLATLIADQYPVNEKAIAPTLKSNVLLAALDIYNQAKGYKRGGNENIKSMVGDKISVHSAGIVKTTDDKQYICLKVGLYIDKSHIKEGAKLPEGCIVNEEKAKTETSSARKPLVKYFKYVSIMSNGKLKSPAALIADIDSRIALVEDAFKDIVAVKERKTKTKTLNLVKEDDIA